MVDYFQAVLVSYPDPQSYSHSIEEDPLSRCNPSAAVGLRVWVRDKGRAGLIGAQVVQERQAHRR